MNVFITGITGTLGSALAKYHHGRGDAVFGCARNEDRVANTRAVWPWGQGVICLDVANMLASLPEIMKHCACRIHRLYHCAADKHVEFCELAPSQVVSQNISKVEQVIEFCNRVGCELVFASSDKACLPTSIYGATKLIGERLVMAKGGAAVRMGNLIGSSGSVFQKWKLSADSGGVIKLTDPAMTRFFLPISRAVDVFVNHALMCHVVVPEMKSIPMGCVASLWPRCQVIGARLGERKHEWAVAYGEQARHADGMFVLGNGILEVSGGTVVEQGYCSKDCEQWTLEDFARELHAVGCLPKDSPKYEMFS